MTLAILCSGQGGQHPAMFELTASVPAAAEDFAAATELLGGRDPRELVRIASTTELQQNRTAQILCALGACSAMAALGEDLPLSRIVAGYSVGEVAAWHVAGLISGPDMLRLTSSRAEAMDAASAGPEGLLFVRGLPRSALEALCRQTSTAIAIINPGDAYLVGGVSGALEELAVACRSAGALRVAALGVHVASHTPRLGGATAAFAEILHRLQPLGPLRGEVRLLSGVDGAAVFDVSAGLHKLALQISHTIDWAACLRGCVEAGASAFLELGPGRALCAMASEAAPGIEARAVDEFRTLAGLTSWVRKVQS